jgi:hypothetical protein
MNINHVIQVGRLGKTQMCKAILTRGLVLREGVINNYQLPLSPLKQVTKQQNFQRQNPSSPNYLRNS